MVLRTAPLRPIFDACAAHYELPWPIPGALAEAFALHESLGDVNATRYEPHQDKTGRADSKHDQDRPGVDDGWVEDDKSYGLMQIMGYNLRALVGIPAGAQAVVDFRWALDPAVNIALGCRFLRDLHRAAYRVTDERRRLLIVLARYNGGGLGNPNDKGKLRTAGYVGKVLADVARVQVDRARTPTGVMTYAPIDLAAHQELAACLKLLEAMR